MKCAENQANKLHVNARSKIVEIELASFKEHSVFIDS